MNLLGRVDECAVLDGLIVAIGAVEDRFRASVPLRGVATAGGYLAVLSDGERPTGAHALAPETDAWLEPVARAIRAHVPINVLAGVSQPSPTPYIAALAALRREIAMAQGVAS